MPSGFDPLGQDLTQLAVGQVRPRIDIIEVEDKGGRVVHPEKLVSVPPLINLVEFRINPVELMSSGERYLIRIPGDSIFPA